MAPFTNATDWNHDVDWIDPIDVEQTGDFEHVSLAELIDRWDGQVPRDCPAVPLRCVIDKHMVQYGDVTKARAWVFRHDVHPNAKCTGGKKIIYTAHARFTPRSFHRLWNDNGTDMTMPRWTVQMTIDSGENLWDWLRASSETSESQLPLKKRKLAAEQPAPEEPIDYKQMYFALLAAQKYPTYPDAMATAQSIKKRVLAIEQAVSLLQAADSDSDSDPIAVLESSNRALATLKEAHADITTRFAPMCKDLLQFEFQSC